MILPEPSYISMKEAAEKFDVSIEHLRWLAEKLMLPVYVKWPYNVSRYAKVDAPLWNVDSIEFCTAISFDEENNVANSSNVMYPVGLSYSMIFIRPNELRNLELEQVGNIKNSPHVIQSSYMKLCHELISDGLSPQNIAKKLKQKYPNLKPAQIGKLLPVNDGVTISYDGHRKRGLRLLGLL
jgi:hypothetical protein